MGPDMRLLFDALFSTGADAKLADQMRRNVNLWCRRAPLLQTLHPQRQILHLSCAAFESCRLYPFSRLRLIESVGVGGVGCL